MAAQHEIDVTGPQAPVWTLMTRAVARIAPDARLNEVAQKLSSVGAGALAVGTTEAVTGIVSERDLTRALGRHNDAATMPASAVASSELVWCEPDTTASAAAKLMCDRGVRHLLVGEAGEGNLRGIVSARDLIEALVTG